METVICTLFEGDYHFGVAALCNSLHNQGYKGEIFAGYKGNLPFWAKDALPNQIAEWENSSTLEVCPGLYLHFLPINTNYHLTNYKPNFMISLMHGPALKKNKLFYFDPDIIITQPWYLYEDWVTYGITLCEDINSPLSKFHPKRLAWKDYYNSLGIKLKYKGPEYANGGFIGVTRDNINFLNMWQQLQEMISSIIGGLSSSCFSSNNLPYAFNRTDQDTLNCAVERWNGRVSFIGKDGMGFNPGMAYMAHALGQPKPWVWNVFYQALTGIPPKYSVREYWKSVEGPILTHSKTVRISKKIAIKSAAFIGRFYKKN